MATKRKKNLYHHRHLHKPLFFESFFPNVLLVLLTGLILYFSKYLGFVPIISAVLFLLGIINIIKWSIVKVSDKKENYSFWAILIVVMMIGAVFVPLKQAIAYKVYRNYSSAGSLYYQRGYIRNNGTYVQPHFKTRPDNTIYNNRKYILGF